MALRAREIYYFVRVGNYATRPLRALQTDFHNLGRAGDAATAQLGRLETQQKRLAASMALRRANIPAMRETNVLRTQERQLALQRSNMALANKRVTIGARIVATENKIDQAIARGNLLEKERVILESKQAAASLRARQSLDIQQARVGSQIAQAARARAMFPAQRRITQLERARAIAQRTAISPLLTPAQRSGALAGRISRAPDVARIQQRYIAAEKAVQSANLAMRKLEATEVTLAERQKVLALSAQKLVAAEEEIKIATQQQALALERLDKVQLGSAAQTRTYRRQLQEFNVQLQLLASEERRLSLAERQLIADRLSAAAAIAKEREALASDVVAMEALTRAIMQQQAAIRKQRWDRIALTGRAISDFGRTAQYAGGLTLLAFAAMARAAAHFRTQVVLAATQVGDAFGNVSDRIKQTNTIATQIQGGLLRQMRQFPASADEMAKASYDIYSSLTLQGDAQEQTAQGLRILRVFQEAAVGGQTKLSEVTNAGITILNQFGNATEDSGKQINQLRKFMDQAFSAVRFGRTTFSEFTTMLANAAPAAKAANQSFANMAGTLAFLTRRLPVRQASVAYARLLEILQRAEIGLKQHGISVRNAAGMYKPLDQIIGQIVSKNPDLVKGRKNIIQFFKEMTQGSGTGTMGTIQARRAFVFLVQQYRQYQQVLRLTTKDQGEFWKSFRALQASPEVKWRIFVNQLHALAIEIGQYAIPALIRMVQPIQRAVEWFEHLSKSQRRQLTTVAIWIAGFTLIGGTIAVVIGAITRIVATLGVFSEKLLGARVAAGGLAAEAGVVGTVLARRLLIGAVIIALIKFHDQTMAVVDALGGLRTILEALLAIAIVSRLTAIGLQLGILEAASITAATRMSMLLGFLTRLAAIGIIVLTIKLLFDTGPGGGSRGIQGAINNALVKARNAVHDTFSTIGLGGLFNPHIDPGTEEAFPFGGWERYRKEHRVLVAVQADSKRSAITIQQAWHKAYQNEIMDAIRTYETVINLNRRKTQLAASLNVPRSQDPFQQARGGPAQAANLKAMQREHVVALKRIHHQQVLNNRTVQQWIALAIRANRFAAAHPHNLQAQIRAAQIMIQIQNRFKGAQLEGIQAVISADTKATKKRIKNAQDLAKEVISHMKEVYDELLQKNQEAFGSIADGVRAANALEWGGIPRASDLLKDMQDQLRKFEQWRSRLMRLRARGLPAGMLAQLQEAGPEKTGLLEGVLRLTPKQLRQYVDMWKRGQRDIRHATEVDFHIQLAQWRSHGRNAAILFMRGMADETSYINKEMRRIFLNWLKSGPKAQQQPRPVPGRPHRNPQTRKENQVEVHHHHNDNITIQDHGEDLSTKIRKARLAQKNRKANRLRWGNH